MQRGHSTSSLGTVTSQPLKMSGFGGTPAFSFGAAAAAPSTAFGGFSPPAATGFGAPAATGFGAPATTGFGTPATTGFGGFGAPATTGFGAPAATGFGGFGAPAATGFGGFGAPAATGFGAPAATGFGAPAATGFGGFGAPAATGFGAPAATAFGAPAATGFGAPAATGFGAPAATGFGGFGAPAATGFGAPAATGFGAPAATGFGAPAATGFGAPASTGFGGFGAPAATGFGGFGAPAATGFGAPAATGFGGFGNIGMAGFGAPTLTPSLATQPGITNFFLGDRVLDIQLSYAPLLDSQTGFPVARTTPDRPYVANEAMCKFDTILYNPKPLGSNTRLQLNTGSRWEQAERDNPDPEALEAVRELGIAALKKRFETQNTECVTYRAHTADLRSIVEGVDTSTRQTGLRVEALQLKQAQLYNKMLAVVRSVEVLRCQGVPIDSSERRYREKLDRMMAALQFPHSKLQELSLIGSKEDRPQDVFSDSMSEEDVEAMCSVLRKQRDGLQHLTDILTKDARDIMIVKQRLKPHVQSEY